MGTPSKILIIFLSGVLLAAASTASAFNITKILESRPEFSTFNSILTQTGVYRGINSRSTVTVLAIPNDNIGDLAGKSLDILINIIRTHVVLDYFDIPKLRNINKPITATTQYQATGVAVYMQGFLNITKAAGQVTFASAVRGAPQNVHLLGSVLSQPFNVSVLSVSGHIVTPGIEPFTFSAPPPKAAGAPATAKPVVEAPAPSEEPEAPAPSEEVIADAPEAESPAEAPDSEAPAPSEAPAADDGDDAADHKSGSSRQLASISLGLLLVFGTFLVTC